MEATLTERWLAGAEVVPIFDPASVAVAREAVREAGARVGLERDAFERLATAASELAHNQLRHAVGGRVGVREVRRGAVCGLEVIAADRGPGLADARSALEGGASSAGGLGQGLAGVHRLADELDVDARLGEGLCVRARVFAGPVPWRSDVAVLGRPYPGEAVSGDDAAFCRTDGALLVAVADGLGHGPPAHEASARAMQAVLADPGRDPEGVVRACDAALVGTRGAVMGVARVDFAAEALEATIVGDVMVHRYRPREALRFTATRGMLGAADLRRRAPRVERMPREPGEVLVLATDGLRTRLDLSSDLALLRQHPLFVAHALLERYGRPDDDALVLVAR